MKRFGILFLSLAVMALSIFCPVGALADTPLSIEATTASADRGQQVQVSIVTKNNPGIISLKVSVTYDPAVLVPEGVAGADFANASFSPLGKNPMIINWVDSLQPNNTTNGTLAVLTFRVLEAAPSGKSTVSLSCNPDDVFDFNYDNVPFTTVDGWVTVLGEDLEPPTQPDDTQQGQTPSAPDGPDQGVDVVVPVDPSQPGQAGDPTFPTDPVPPEGTDIPISPMPPEQVGQPELPGDPILPPEQGLQPGAPDVPDLPLTPDIPSHTDVVVLGNLNGDEVINAKDALLVLQMTVSKCMPDPRQEAAADVNKNGIVEAKDALEILKYSVGKPSCLDGEGV